MTDASRPPEGGINLLGESLALAIIAAGVALIGYELIRPMLAAAPDSRVILEQYGAAFRAGLGFTFNPAERTLLIAAPLYIVLAGITNGTFLFALAMGVCAGVAYAIGRTLDYPRYVTALAGGLVGLAWPLWASAGTAAPVAAAFGGLGLALLLKKRLIWAGLSMAAAVLCAPEALIPAVWVILYLRSEGEKGEKSEKKGEKGATARYGIPLFGALGAAALLLTLYYGPAWPAALLVVGKMPANSLDSLTLPFAVALCIAALPVWYARRADRAVGLLGGWVIISAGAVIGMLRATESAPYATLIIPAAVLAAGAFQKYQITAVLAVFGAVIGGVLIALSGPLPAAPMPIPPLPTVSHIAAPNTATALRLTHLSRQTITALDGGLQPELRRLLERDDLHSALIRYAPDVILRGAEDWLALPAAKTLGYALNPTGDYYERGRMVGAGFANRTADQGFGPHLRLTGYGVDRGGLRAGALLRIRLDWAIGQNAVRPVTVIIRVEDGQRVIATLRDEFAPTVFSRGVWSTYHALLLPPDAGSGNVGLSVAVSVNGGLFPAQMVGVVGLD